MSDAIVKIKESDIALLIAAGVGFVLLSRNELKNVERSSITNNPVYTTWTPPKSADLYIPTIRDAERVNGIPHNLLARVLYQESRFRPDIITGETKSSAGAVGIAQIVPKWHPDAKPLDPFHSIWYASKYLRNLYNRFGNWEHALAAYNWGQGNLSKYLAGAISTMPRETMNYVSEITGDVVT